MGANGASSIYLSDRPLHSIGYGISIKPRMPLRCGRAIRLFFEHEHEHGLKPAPALTRLFGFTPPSPLIPHPSSLTPPPSPLTPHPSHLTPHTSPLTPHTSHLTPHTSPRPTKTPGATVSRRVSLIRLQSPGFRLQPPLRHWELGPGPVVAAGIAGGVASARRSPARRRRLRAAARTSAAPPTAAWPYRSS